MSMSKASQALVPLASGSAACYSGLQVQSVRDCSADGANSLAANVSYFAAATPDELKKAGVTTASLFFYKVYGPHAARALA